jgi:four helix bundle protein
MKYERFEDLPVWQDGIQLTVKVFKVTEDKIFRFKGDIANQMQRAALSVPNNIAEGFERGTTQELITFLYYARGSAGEVRSILAVMEKMPVFECLKAQTLELKALAESISRQIRGWTGALQNTKIEGQRYVTDKSKRIYDNDIKRKEFEEMLKQYRPKI